MIKKVFVLKMTMWNGMVPLETTCSVFATRELAEQTLAVLKEKNSKQNKGPLDVGVSYSISESDMYVSEADVPILNLSNEDNSEMNND